MGEALLLAVTPGLRWLVARLTVEAREIQPGGAVRASCDGCGLPLRPGSAAWSALLPAGRCGGCGHRIGAPAYAMEILTLIGVLLAIPLGPAAIWWVLCAAPLLFIDMRVRRLPDPLTGAALAGVLLLETIVAAAGDEWGALARAVLCALVHGSALLVFAVIAGPRGLGLGDVKLFASIAALFGWWSWSAVFGVLFLAFLGSGLVAAGLLITGRVRRGADIAMGPYLVGGSLAMFALLAA